MTCKVLQSAALKNVTTIPELKDRTSGALEEVAIGDNQPLACIDATRKLRPLMWAVAMLSC